MIDATEPPEWFEKRDEQPDQEPNVTETTSLTGVVQPQIIEDPPRSQVLREAEQLINGHRQSDYGPPSENLQRIADLWNVQFAALLAPGKKFRPLDVALGMTQVKMARAVQSLKRDTFVDGAGYLGLAYEMSLLDD